MQKKKPRKFFEFGSYHILQVKKTDTYKKEKWKFFVLPPLFGQRSSENWEVIYQLIAVCDSDTAFINLVIPITTVTHTPGFFSKKDETSSSHIDSIFAVLKISNDTIPWTIRAGKFWFNQNIAGLLRYNNDEYAIEGEDRFQGNEKAKLGPFPKGIIVKDKTGKQLGAIQFRKKFYSWLSKDLAAPLKLAIATTLSLVLSTLESIGSN
ncbi:MAG TPA: hypothetical protein VF476_16040 [Chitinophagaceae bacterium]